MYFAIKKVAASGTHIQVKATGSAGGFDYTIRKTILNY